MIKSTEPVLKCIFLYAHTYDLKEMIEEWAYFVHLTWSLNVKM